MHSSNNNYEVFNKKTDFDVDDYSTNELLDLFDLNPDILSEEVINEKYNQLLQKVLDKYKDKKERKEILKFLFSSKERIIEYYGKDSQILDTTVITTDKPKFNKYSEPETSTLPHFVQNTYLIDNNFINPLDISYKTRILVFNSVLCDENIYQNQTNNSNQENNMYTFTFPQKIENVIGMKLSALQFPNIQPTISSVIGNNHIQIIFDDNNVEINKTGYNTFVYIPDGYYPNTDSMNIVLQYYINITLFPTFYPIATTPKPPIALPNPLISVTNNIYTGKTTITNIGYKNPETNELYTFSMIFEFTEANQKGQSLQNLQCQAGYNISAPYPFSTYIQYNKLPINTFGYVIGFRNILYSLQKSYTSFTIYNPVPNPYVYFSLNDFNINRLDDIEAVLPGYFFNKDILAVIPVTGTYPSSVLDTGANFIFKSRNYSGPVEISKIKVSFYSQTTALINLYDTAFTFILELKMLYNNPASKKEYAIQAFTDSSTS